MRCLPIVAALSASLVLMACTSMEVSPPDPDNTSLHRFDGEPLRRRDIEAHRPGGIALARAIMLVERELHEPWAEHRDAAVLIEDAASMAGDDFRRAREVWKLSEPVPRGLRREAFCELGFFGENVPNRVFQPSIMPATFEAEVARILGEHSDKNERAQFLAAWRHFSPEVSQRRAGYLACAWRFELESAEVMICESLLGPHRRSQVLGTGRAFLGGVPSSVDGYSAAEGVLALVSPGAPSPVVSAIDVMVRATASNQPLPLEIEGGYVRVALSADDREFLLAALKGLSQGCCDIAYLPRGCTRVEAAFDYLVGNAEARATLGFSRSDNGWILDELIYEPAAATVVGKNGAALDLISMLRHSEPQAAVARKPR